MKKCLFLLFIFFSSFILNIVYSQEIKEMNQFIGKNWFSNKQFSFIMLNKQISKSILSSNINIYSNKYFKKYSKVKVKKGITKDKKIKSKDKIMVMFLFYFFIILIIYKMRPRISFI